METFFYFFKFLTSLYLYLLPITMTIHCLIKLFNRCKQGKLSKKFLNCKLKTSETWPKADTKKATWKTCYKDIFNKSHTNKVKMKRLHFLHLLICLYVSWPDIFQTIFLEIHKSSRFFIPCNNFSLVFSLCNCKSFIAVHMNMVVLSKKFFFMIYKVSDNKVF